MECNDSATRMTDHHFHSVTVIPLQEFDHDGQVEDIVAWRAVCPSPGRFVMASALIKALA